MRLPCPLKGSGGGCEAGRHLELRDLGKGMMDKEAGFAEGVGDQQVGVGRDKQPRRGLVSMSP